MPAIDTMATIKKFRESGKINPRYDIDACNMQAIMHEDMGVWGLITNSFTFGYAQGYKAAKAEIKKRNEVSR